MRDGAYLDLGALTPGFLRARFPTVAARCAAHGVDVDRGPIPVVPAAHFSCGGVHTDLAGRTNVRNLGAIGETACTGLHGANRLASTSLLECLVGARAAAAAAVTELAAERAPLPRARRGRGAGRRAEPTVRRQELGVGRRTRWN